MEPRDVVVARGQSALLDCVVDDGFLPASTSSSTSGAAPGVVGEEFQIVWFQNRVRIDLPDARRRLLTNGSLYFEKVSWSIENRPGTILERASYLKGGSGDQ